MNDELNGYLNHVLETYRHDGDLIKALRQLHIKQIHLAKTNYENEKQMVEQCIKLLITFDGRR